MRIFIYLCLKELLRVDGYVRESGKKRFVACNEGDS
jgi:hypothetical protein